MVILNRLFCGSFKMTENELIELCIKYDIRNYTINDDMSIDVDDEVVIDLYRHQLTALPLTFGKVTKKFVCSRNELTTLKGCPTYVGRYFDCRSNRLTSLEFCPSYVGTSFHCSYNLLTSLDYCPNYVGGDFVCIVGKITTRRTMINVDGQIYVTCMWKF